MGELGLTLRVVVVLDAGAARGRDLAALAAAARGGGATMLQVRAKTLGAGDLAALTRRIIEAAGGLPVVVNDRLDVALAAGAAGCHLGQDDFPLADARAVATPGFVLGGSAGTEAEALRAAAAGADYLGIGPIRGTRHKADAGEAIGAAGFARVLGAAAGLPAVAIGGVTAADVPDLIGAGAAGVAAIGAVLDAEDPGVAARALREAVDAAMKRGAPGHGGTGARATTE